MTSLDYTFGPIFQDYKSSDKFFKKHGWCMIKAFEKEQMDHYQDLLWSYFEGLSENFDREDKKSWYFPPSQKGIFKTHGVGHCQLLWELRTHKNIKRIFEQIWDEKDLITSFDGLGFFTKPSRQRLWPHVDQKPTNRSFETVQAAVNIFGNERIQDGGLVVWDKSHLLDLSNYESKTDFFLIPDQQKISFDKGWILRAPAGTVFLWDSRLVHCNVSPFGKDSGYRAVAYISMSPRKMASKKMLEKRRKYFLEKRTTNHHPFCVKVNPKTIFRADCIIDKDYTGKSIPEELWKEAEKLV